MPVLPLVGSTIVAPGLSFPWRSAVSIMFKQMRSLTDPPGLKDSSLAHTSASFLSGRALSFTTGVEPIRSRTDRAPFKPATICSSFLVGVKFDLMWIECYSFALGMSMKSPGRVAASSHAARACVIFPGALGDFVCFLPALQVITRVAHVDLFAHSEFSGIVPPNVTVRALESVEVSQLFVRNAAQNSVLQNFFGAYSAVYSWMGGGLIEFVDQLQP